MAGVTPFSVSVIIPAYNEEAIIQQAVQQAYEILTQQQADFEIIVVNDCSTDNTAAILNASFGNIPGIQLHHKSVNEGFGSAIRSGIARAGKTYIFCIPADSPLNTDLYTAFSIHAAKADVLVSYRKKRVGYSWLKLFNSWLYHLVISLLFNMRLRDYNWIHLYHRKIFEAGKIEIEYNGIFMLAEILIKARRLGFTFYQLEVEQKERLTGMATASKLSAILQTAANTLSFWWRG